MTILFTGAAGEVTGSCHLLETEWGLIALDCGMFQGGAERHLRNREKFPVNPQEVTAVLLSHAHLDHCGRLPLFVRDGFSGKIFATDATCQLTTIVLHDAATLNEEDANWKIKRLKKKGEDWSWVTPLFSTTDVEKMESHLEPVPYNQWQRLNKGMQFRFLEAGHLLGSAMIDLRWKVNGKERSLLFTGDIGPMKMPIVRDPARVEGTSVLLMESTYGDRNHSPKDNYQIRFGQIINETIANGGVVIIPSFAVGRTQEVLYVLSQLMREKVLAPVDVFVDSPMAEEVTKVYHHHLSLYDEEASSLVRQGRDPLSLPSLKFLRSVEESKTLNERQEPFVVIAGSGMCTGGRVKHHLAHRISDPKNTIIFVGFQAEGTLGRQIVDGVSPVRIFGEHYPVRARVEVLDAFSAHADQSELVRWTEGFLRPPEITFLVHGEKERAMVLQRILSERGWNCWIPESGQRFTLAVPET
ncbi:MAG: MBL fold metallo-hydrolase [Armatimonadetes bacterium]|nr:MBL fold metallo-hydrolase [Armatimonadota bacterium]MDW8122653.1 MBL fold metallo-hydrolase [Armatimonadota bacterium]